MTYWYAATPYSKHPRGTDAAFVEAAVAAADLVRAGVLIYCPVTHSHPIAVHGGIDRYDYSVWMPINEALMEAATGIVVIQLNGWAESIGIKHEVEWFMSRGRSVLYWRPGDSVPEGLLRPGR